MLNDMDITLWMNEHRLEALCQHYRHLEKVVEGYLQVLYERHVPAAEQETIEAQVQVEQVEYDRYHEQNRRFALLEVVENGASRYFETDECTTLFAAASRFVSALKTQQVQGKHFQGNLIDLAFGDCLETDPAYMQDYTSHCRGDPRVVFCAKVNFDHRFIHGWVVGYGGWTEYNNGQLTDGVRAATRKGSLTTPQQEKIFTAKINENNPDFDADEDADMGLQMQ